MSHFVPKQGIQRLKKGVPTVAQWVKNPTEVAWVAVEAQVQSLAWCSGFRI